MGILLALLLGAVAGVVIFVLPIGLLENITTTVGLSRLMVQAEPPISPSDRMLLSALVGLLTAGIGWILIDWLVFGRAGMSRLIRIESDDFEDEEAYSFRSTDPLDLVAPMQTTDGWSQPMSADARKPLSALSDIGGPPIPPAGSAFAADTGQIAPGVGVAPPPLPATGAGALSPARPAAAMAPAERGWIPTPGMRSEAEYADLDDGAGAGSDEMARAVSHPVEVSARSPQEQLDAGSMAMAAEPQPVAEPEPGPGLLQPATTPPAISPSRGWIAEPYDRSRMLDLLDRIERGLARRRAAAGIAPAVPPGYAARPPAFGSGRAMPGVPATPARGVGGNLLDQPLHVALETLRSRVKQ